jgi:serine phosphatase RsbU (regulator of sigma subunit)
MDATPVVHHLLVLYVGLILINVALTALLWARSRDPLYRWLFVAWTATALSFVAQGALTQNSFLLAVGFAFVFPVNFAFAHAVGVGMSFVVFSLGSSFTLVGLPVAVAVAAPCAVTGVRAIRRRGRLSSSALAMTISCLLFSLHNLDWAFLRDRPEFAALGFTLAILIIFALSVSGPAVALERVSAEQSRIAAELDAARRIQSKILPQKVSLPGLELVTHVRPAASVGGDYFDAYQVGPHSWILLGDVTGHGLGAGLVMLMAQSTISSILQARRDISPRELNYLANEILHSNLARLDERRHMTVVAIRAGPEGRLTVSGSHDDLFVFRAHSGDVESVGVQDFPMGLGFWAELEPHEVSENELALAEGDLLFLGTDGVTEASRHGDPSRGVFGDARLCELLRRHARDPLDAIRQALVRELDAFTGGNYQDDVAFMIARRSAANTEPRV